MAVAAAQTSARVRACPHTLCVLAPPAQIIGIFVSPGLLTLYINMSGQVRCACALAQGGRGARAAGVVAARAIARWPYMYARAPFARRLFPRPQAPYQTVLQNMAITIIAPLVFGQLCQFFVPKAVAWLQVSSAAGGIRGAHDAPGRWHGRVWRRRCTRCTLRSGAEGGGENLPR